MGSPLAKAEGMRRIRKLIKSSRGNYSAIFVMSPHRYSAQMLRELKSGSQQLIALLGDDPVGPRSVRHECWDYFDLILAADKEWTRNIPPTVADRRVMPWGSTIVDTELVDANVYVPESLVLVGTPYPQRVALAKSLASRYPVTLQGEGWPQIPKTKQRPSASRRITLDQIRRNRELVINMHHHQFHRGLNPQFFDYAAAGIPQVVVHADDLDTYRLGLDGLLIEGSFYASDLLKDTAISDLTKQVVASVREAYMFHSCVGRFVV
jgi:hypothetical protein